MLGAIDITSLEGPAKGRAAEPSGKPMMYLRSIRDLRADALFASARPAAGGSVRGGNVAAENAGDRVMDDELIRVCAVAARVACRRMTPRYLKALHDSVEQACCLPSGFDWDRKVTAHAEIVNLLAEAVGDPALAVLVRDVSGQLHDLMVAVGPAASGIIASSRRRLLALLRAGDAHGAAREMEQHLGGLLWMRRVSRRPAPTTVQADIAV
jgi:FCD domain-containing protein